MKVLEAEVKAINNEIEIIVIGDTHIGSPNFNEQLLNDTIKYVLEKKNRFVILNGDIVDCTFKDSVGSVYENAMTPSVALSYACLKLKPLVDAHRILCSIGGNHDHDRSAKQIDISIAQQLATLLGIPTRFSADSVVLFVTAREGVKGNSNHKATYKLFCSHGNNGGGGTIGSKANAVEKMSLICPNADVYIHSHTHSPLTFKDAYVDICDTKKQLIWRERMYVNTNAFLTYFNSYGEKKLLRPQSMKLPVIKLKTYRSQEDGHDRERKSITCEI